VYVLEIGLVVSLTFRWLDFFLTARFHVATLRVAGDAATNFAFLALLLLLLITLGLLVTRQPRAGLTALHAFIFLLWFVFTPARLGSTVPVAMNRPNQAMERTADRRTLHF
jgi:hypothetical protein